MPSGWNWLWLRVDLHCGPVSMKTEDLGESGLEGMSLHLMWEDLVHLIRIPAAIYKAKTVGASIINFIAALLISIVHQSEQGEAWTHIILSSSRQNLLLRVSEVG